MKRAAKRRTVDTVEKLAILTQEGFTEVRRDIEGFRRETNRRFSTIEDRLGVIEREIVDIHRRLDSLGEQGARQAGYSKEIDYLLSRVSRIEKHLKLA